MKDPDKITELPVLTMEAMAPEVCDADRVFEPAMSFPLPPNPDSRLLNEARRQVLAYLDWITTENGVKSEGPDWSVHEIRRACARLVEITEILPAALDTESEADLISRFQGEGRGGDNRATASGPKKVQTKGYDR
jgi:hypothetical protein